MIFEYLNHAEWAIGLLTFGASGLIIYVGLVVLPSNKFTDPNKNFSNNDWKRNHEDENDD